MLEINLLPPEMKKKRQRAAAMKMPDLGMLTGIPLPLMIAGFFGLIICVQLVAFGLVMLADAQHSSFNERSKNVMPLVKEVKALKGEIETLSNKTKAIDEIIEKRILWSKKLNDLSDSVTPGIWLTRLYYEEKLKEEVKKEKKKRKKRSKKKGKEKEEEIKPVRIVGITGYAYTKYEDPTTSVTKFIESMKANEDFAEDFSSIEVGGPIQEAMVYDVDAMSLKYPSCRLKGLRPSP
ncbi:PilN domain-containing protein [Candidatus Omnitrophota bacterium]